MAEALSLPDNQNVFGGSFTQKFGVQAYQRQQYEQYDTPVYRLIKPYFAEDHGGAFYPEDSVIAFDGTPNEQMEPMNRLAEAKMRVYLEELPPTLAKVPTFKGSGTPELGDIIEGMMKMRPRHPEPIAAPDDVRERVISALAAGEQPDPADLKALLPQRHVEMPHKDDEVPLMSGVPLDGSLKRGPGRPPKAPVSMVAVPGEAPKPTKIMGGMEDVGPDAPMAGPGGGFNAGTRVSRGL